MRRAAVAWSIAFLSAASHAQEMPEDSGRWARVSVGNFEILSDAGERRALQIPDTVQRLTEAIDQATMLETASKRPTVIFAFRRPADFRPYRDLVMGRGTDKTGVFLSRRHADYILLDTTYPEMDPLLLHELTHGFVRNTFPRAPLWLNEGLAEFFGTFESRGERALFGVPSRDAIAILLRQPLIPMRDMLAMTGTAEDFRQGPRVRLVYAQSWAMVHYILIGNDSTGKQLPDYVDRVTSSEASTTAFFAAFGMTPEDPHDEAPLINDPSGREICDRRSRALSGRTALRARVTAPGHGSSRTDTCRALPP